MKTLNDLLRHYPHFEKVVSSEKPFKKLDFSTSNSDLLDQDLSSTATFTAYVFEKMLSENKYIGIGGYDEDRVIYRQREHFSAPENVRSIHLGVDIWADAGESVYAPTAGKVHSFALNDNPGDYGPTIILEHTLENHTFYTLYGHLSLDSLEGLYEGKTVKAGEKIASIGPFPINGDWPPHLHFQVITDIGTYRGDFPGVSSISNRAKYLELCPDPNLILRTGAK